jgi:hypothetical protein
MNEHFTHESDDDYVEHPHSKEDYNKSVSGCAPIFFTSLISLVALVILLFLLLSDKPKEEVMMKPNCNGAYTILEYGRGIDCNGDTVRLEKVNGFQVLVR